MTTATRSPLHTPLCDRLGIRYPIRNAFDREWLDLGLPALPLAGVQYERVGKPAAIRAREEGDVEHGSAAAGQSAGLIRDVRPVAQVMASIVEEAEAILLKLGPKLGQPLGAGSEA